LITILRTAEVARRASPSRFRVDPDARGAAGCQGHPMSATTLLIVDDHGEFRDLARALLERGGFTVTGEAATGEQALAEAVRLRPQVVLLDVQLPDRDGFGVCRDLVAMLPGTRVVLCSIRPAGDYGSRPGACGSCGFLVKADLSAAAVSRLLASSR
jgi:DNA-binding NarL/FixJ family response regulator